MVAQFPAFSPLQVADRARVQSLTAPFAPYSDFNFVSLYSWDTREAVRVSELNGNLVVRFTDYTTSTPFYSFIGDKLVDDTAARLLALARSEGLPEELRLVPEVAAQHASPGRLGQREDGDNFDYILSIERLKSYQGNKLGPKRNFVNRFNREHEARAVILDLSNIAVQTRVLDMFHRWMIQKGERADNADNELLALHRAMFAARFVPDLFTVGTFVDGDLAGFSINEVLSGGYGMIHFEKADESYVGVYAHLMQQMACLMGERGCLHVNYEQDLGVFGLRKGKKSYLPEAFLRKYSLVSASAQQRPPLPWAQDRRAPEAARDERVIPRTRPTPLDGLAVAGMNDVESGPRRLPPSLYPGTQMDLPPLSRANVARSRVKSGEWVRASYAPAVSEKVMTPWIHADLERAAVDLEDGSRTPTERARDAVLRATRRLGPAPIPREEPEAPRVVALRPEGARARKAG